MAPDPASSYQERLSCGVLSTHALNTSQSVEQIAARLKEGDRDGRKRNITKQDRENIENETYDVAKISPPKQRPYLHGFHIFQV